MYANIIVDISHEKVDRPFQYRIPPKLEGQIQVGMQVKIPFGAGNYLRKGYVMELTMKPEYDIEKIKEIAGIEAGSVTAESRLIQLAWWLKEHYGSTMNQALKTVLPVKEKVRSVEQRQIASRMSEEQLKAELEVAKKRHYKARERLFEAFLRNAVIPYETAMKQMNLSAAALKPLIEKNLIVIESEQVYRNPLAHMDQERRQITLNEQQCKIVDDFTSRYHAGIREVSLIHGITGSGKTEVYMELIACVLSKGRQVIVLIPEIALTYQTVMRFYQRFGNVVSVMNSRLSRGERYDQFERAKKNEIQIMIGPRSALFTPFPDLGLIIIDEEHETAYKSELAPRYHARETAVWLAEKHHASVVLGSATPSLEAYSRACSGEYRLYQLNQRAKESSRLPEVEIIDLREELKEGNKSIFSRRLREMMEDRLEKKEQMILFMNRRGYAGFVSCRSCGEAIRCPHCDVSLTLHYGQKLICHYCGHQIPMPGRCPSCGSPYIAPFGTGTQKIEELTKQMFPQARVLRMDADTTGKKGGHEEILSSFARGEADILIGTQMIVKGHDFPKVTLAGILAADLSLYSPDFRCSERTFQLLTQAAGRAGRGETPGNVVIQTYQPDHYSISCSASQDYESFYRQEMSYRKMLGYPPVCQMLSIQFSSRSETLLNQVMKEVTLWTRGLEQELQVGMIGPAPASVYKVNDIYRKILYLKQENYDILIKIKNRMEQWTGQSSWHDAVMVQYDFS